MKQGFIMVAAIGTWAIGGMLWVLGVLPFVLLALVFCMWIASFVRLERAAMVIPHVQGSMRDPARECFWSSVVLAAMVLILL